MNNGSTYINSVLFTVSAVNIRDLTICHYCKIFKDFGGAQMIRKCIYFQGQLE